MGLKRFTRRNMRALALRPPRWSLTKDERFLRDVASGLSPDDVVVDLGAHIGLAALEFGHFVGKVYAFEPHPVIFEQLRHNTRKMSNIVPLNKAVSDVPGTCTLYSDDADEGFTEGSTLAMGKSNVSYDNSYQVETVNLADFIRDLGQPVRMIKMDIEGLEYRIINTLLDGDVMGLIGMVHVEDHCDRIDGLAAERDRVLARIDEMGLADKFDFEWP